MTGRGAQVTLCHLNNDYLELQPKLCSWEARVTSVRYSDYPDRARRLADAGASLLETIEDPEMDRSVALRDFEAATTTTTANLHMSFEPGEQAGPTTQASPEDALSQLLLELQSANALMSAGMALNEHGRGADSKYLDEAVSQTRAVSLDVASQHAESNQLHFEPQTRSSEKLDDAVKLFRSSADRALESIASGTEGVISSAFEKLKDVDRSKVTEAIADLGKSFEIVATVGRLIRKGLEKLKAVLDYLSNIFGADALADIKKSVREVWDKFGGDHRLVPSIIGVPTAKERVAAFAAQAGLQIAQLDGVSRELAFVEDRYQGMRKILTGLVSGIVLAMGIIAALQVFGLFVAAPWIALAAAGAYVAVIGAALLVGLNYTGSRPMFQWIKGVCVIVPVPQK